MKKLIMLVSLLVFISTTSAQDGLFSNLFSDKNSPEARAKREKISRERAQKARLARMEERPSFSKKQCDAVCRKKEQGWIYANVEETDDPLDCLELSYEGKYFVQGCLIRIREYLEECRGSLIPDDAKNPRVYEPRYR